MISIETIERDIIELESRDTSYVNCERLATLYTVYDHLKGYNLSPEVAIALNGSSDFIQAINGKNPNDIFPIIDELMEVIQALQPKVYDKVMQKIKEI